VYVTGSTDSPDFPLEHPLTTNQVLGGGTGTSTDAFVTKLDATGTALLYSTFLGDTDEDVGNSIFVDGAGNAYVTGSTKSPGFPATPGAFQTTFGGTMDAFVTKITESATPSGGNSVSDGGGGGGCFIATASAFEPRR
jgi:hypothetical protein